MVGCPSCRFAVTVEAVVGQGSLSGRDGRRSAWTLAERFQVMMLSGRSA